MLQLWRPHVPEFLKFPVRVKETEVARRVEGGSKV